MLQFLFCYEDKVSTKFLYSHTCVEQVTIIAVASQNERQQHIRVVCSIF